MQDEMVFVRPPDLVAEILPLVCGPKLQTVIFNKHSQRFSMILGDARLLKFAVSDSHAGFEELEPEFAVLRSSNRGQEKPVNVLLGNILIVTDLAHLRELAEVKPGDTREV